MINFEQINEKVALLTETLAVPAKVKTAHTEELRYRLYEMANALTLRQPTTLPLPTLLLASEENKLFDPVAMSKFTSGHGNKLLNFRVLRKNAHLNCLFRTQEVLCQHLETLRQVA
ncbi:hypothetical protein [Xenorhabdus entomophaga]|uniref:hypothetical protein n=1 Tax=Xenorhabdus entomophaga TaxID=3136257 RepID=UPI0030F482BD